MTSPHPRDPRLRRAGHRDPLDAAVRLEVAVGAMRAQQLEDGPEDEPTAAEWQETAAVLSEVAPELVEPFEAIAADHLATAAQLGTVEPPISAQQFADALAAEFVPGEQFEPLEQLAGSPSAHPERTETPAAAPPVTPPPAPPPGPRVFDSEHRRPLGWRSRHDPRSRLYGVADRLPGRAPMQDRMWPSGWPTLDQGAEGACVGMSVAGWANTRGGPSASGEWLTAVEALELYRRAQQLDAIPGEDYSGTSVLAGLQAGVEAGLFGGYLWAFGTSDIRQAILQRGPVIIGIPWLSGMYQTGPGGLVEPTGERVGGHALVVVGILARGPQGQPGPFFVWHNSWGDDYGDGGLGYIHHRHLSQLLTGSGEAAIPTAEPQEPRP